MGAALRKPYFRFSPIKGQLIAEEPAVAGHCTFKSNCLMGAFSYIGKNSELTQTKIGRYCSLAPGVIIGATEHPTDRFSTHLISFRNNGPFSQSEQFQKIAKGSRLYDKELPMTTIGHDVWIGANAVIRRGIHIDHGAIIGAGAVVTTNVEAYQIVGGVPAKHIKYRFEPAICQRLLALEWWLYDLSECGLTDEDYDDIQKFLAKMESLKNANALSYLTPDTYHFFQEKMIKIKKIY